MEANKENIEKLRVYATLTDTLDKYVYLKEDKDGTYIEYAFLEGAPHDNRCLSWYFSFQPEAIKRNCLAFGHSDEYVQEQLKFDQEKIKKKVGNLYEISSFTCGHEEYPELSLKEAEESWTKYHTDEPFVPEDHVCKVGCPAKVCRDITCQKWTYKEPVKCACWHLSDIQDINRVSIPINVAIKLFDEIIKLK